MGHGPIRTRPWKRPPWRRKRRLPGEFNIISEATATALAASSPFRDGSCGQNLVVSGALDCDETAAFVPTILSSASEGDFGGQPIWPKHTVESVRGQVFFFNAGNLLIGNSPRPAPGVMIHMGIRKTRFDYDAVTPSFETDFDPAHEDDAEARWIWLHHLYLPPVPAVPNASAIEGDGSGAGWIVDFRDGTSSRASVTINERNRVHLSENEGLVLICTASRDPYSNVASPPMGAIQTDGRSTEVVMLNYLRTYVRQSGK